ncbi:MAG: hypothetical protein AAB441_05380 [Patescibacteria group bacterium]
MTNEFPTVTVDHIGGDSNDEAEFFRVNVPQIDETNSLATKLFGKRVLEVSSETALKEFDTAIYPAVQLLAVAITSCNTCPVKQGGVCTGMQPINFRDTGIYQATVEVLGKRDWSVHNATEQLSGANCGINPSQLNKLNSIKVG